MGTSEDKSVEPVAEEAIPDLEVSGEDAAQVKGGSDIRARAEAELRGQTLGEMLKTESQPVKPPPPQN